MPRVTRARNDFRRQRSDFVLARPRRAHPDLVLAGWRSPDVAGFA